MKVFAISDIHIDFEENRQWLHSLSRERFGEDVLILAGDISDRFEALARALEFLKDCFSEVLFVPGNHDLWVRHDKGDSLEKFERIKSLARDTGVRMAPLHRDGLSIVPLFGWYDHSFGPPSRRLSAAWRDYFVCRWPEGFDEDRLTRHFVSMNEPFLDIRNRTVISFSHFLPRIDLMPIYIPARKRLVYPVLGTRRLEAQIRRLGSHIHIYGHSHVNRRVSKDGTKYVNNAYGYPHEKRIASKKMRCVFDPEKK